jgi:hypothetical protein
MRDEAVDNVEDEDSDEQPPELKAQKAAELA